MNLQNAYTQCRLVKGTRVDIAWIDTEFATMGKVLRIKIDKKWDDGWIVKEIYSTASKNTIVNRSKDHRRISTFMPK